MADERDLIRSRTNIVDLVSQRVSLKKTGKSWTGLCPFHDDRNPSFHVNPDLGVYKCWSCGVGGDVFTWVMETEHVDFGEALRILAKQAGVELKRRDRREPSQIEAQEAAMADALTYFREQLSKSKTAKEYCANRGLDAATLDTWEIGYAPDVNGALATYLQKKGHSLTVCKDLFLVDKDPGGGYFDKFRARLMFPIRDERGRLVAFGGRIIGDGQPKYINSSDTPLYSKSRVLYGMNRAKESMPASKQAVLVEGYLDVIACHTAGVTTAVASLGTALADDHVRLLKRWCEEVVVLYDSDAAGQKASERACEMLTTGGLRVRVALVPEGKDPDTLLRQHGAEAVRTMVESPLSETGYLVARLELRQSPSSDAFWDEAAEILAKAKRHQDVVGTIDQLAPKYPYTSDRREARLAIERMVKAIRARDRKGGASAKAQQALPKRRLKGYEAAVIKALLVPELTQEAWAVCKRPELFVTAAGKSMAEALSEQFPDGLPSTAVVTWLPQMEKTDLRDMLVELSSEMHVLLRDREALLLQKAVFQSAVEKLVELHEDRERDKLRASAKMSAEDAQKLMAELKKAKGGTTFDATRRH